jgi:aspartate beta-hydroxylase
MDYHGAKSAVNRFLLRYAGWDERPVFFDVDAICPELRELERAYPRIRAELDALLERRVDMPQHHEINQPATAIFSSTKGKWKVFMLELLGHRPQRNRARCPTPAPHWLACQESCRLSSRCSSPASRCRCTMAPTSATCAITSA